MKESGRFRIIKAIFAGLAFALSGALYAEEQPGWTFEIIESDKAIFEAEQFHAKDGAWLLTFRMRVKSLSLIPPISRIEFEGKIAAESEDEEAEVVWTKSHTIRRKDFNAAYGGGRSQFVRVFFKDVPPELTSMEMSYLKVEEAE